jgi:GT2 family glycosyltransferase
VALSKKAHHITTAGMGVLGATGAMIAKSAWDALGGFDDRYQTGGEDTALANSMLQGGYRVVQEPALTVHHSHGLGLRDSVKQYKHQLQILKAPRQFDRQALLKRRPDLRANRTSDDR